jgi:spermidine/putrescine transport system permease protein
MKGGRTPNHERHRLKRGWLLSVLPGGLWEALFLVVPFAAILVISFFSRGEYGGVERPLTIENYKRLAGYGIFGFEALYPLIILRSLVLALATAIFCGAAGLPLAFFVARRTGGNQTLALVFLTIPIWTNLLVRTYAWQLLLGPASWFTQFAIALHLLKPGESLYPGTLAVLLCLGCDYLPFAALPIYASVEKIDRSLIEAAEDLGATRWAVFRHGIYPQIRAGLWAGLLLVFLPATGQFVIPDLLGGAKTILIGNVLQQQFGPSRDWPFGAAFASVSMLCVLGGLLLYFRVSKQKVEIL